MEIREIGVVYKTNINLQTNLLGGYIHPAGGKFNLSQDNRIL